MQIIYLYIQSYRNLHKQNLNFGSEYNFRYSEKSKTIYEEKNELYLDNFYNIYSKGKVQAQINNVTSIIGENGTGKSNLLKFITENLSEGTPLTHEIILITKESNGLCLYSTFVDISYNKNLIKNYKKIGKITEGEFDFGYDMRGLDNTDIIILSNILDGSPGINLKGIYDITTNNLIHKDHQRNVEQHIIDRDKDPVQVFYAEELFRQLNFISSNLSKNKIPFHLPTFLTIRPYKAIIESEPKNLYKASQNILENFQYDYKLEEGVLNKDYTHTGLNQLIAYSLINLLKELFIDQTVQLSFQKDLSSNLHFVNKDETLLIYEKLEDRVEFLFKAIENSHIKTNGLNSQLVELVNNTSEFIKYLISIKHLFINRSPSLQDPLVLFKISENGNFHEDQLKTLIQKYILTFNINPYLEFRWRELSSGESALLNIYSRLYSLSNSVKIGSPVKKNLILLLDEIDLYLHPQWQKGLLNSLLKILPEIFSNNDQRHIQIISTTNSPIPASDLLNYNTIFLERVFVNGHLKTVINDSLKDQKETFAANIHTLLADSFFVKDGLFGDFAKFVINDIIDKLQKYKDITHDQRHQIRKTIHQIGEPVIKNKLIQMYNDRFNFDIHERLDDIEKKLR